MGGAQTVRVDSGRLFVCLFVCLFVWFTWDGPVNEEIPILLYSESIPAASGAETDHQSSALTTRPPVTLLWPRAKGSANKSGYFMICSISVLMFHTGFQCEDSSVSRL